MEARRRIQRTVCYAVNQTLRTVHYFVDNDSDLEAIGIDRVTHSTAG